MTPLQILVGVRNRLRVLTDKYWHGPLLRWRLRARGMQVGSNLCASGHTELSLHYSAKVVVGDNCRFVSDFHYTAVGGFRPLQIAVGPGGFLQIGRGVGLSNCSIVCCQQIRIGDDVRLGGDCRIYDSDFHSLNAAERIQHGDCTTKMAPVVIGDRAFIGAHSIILKGVTIGEEAVVGAGAVVSKSIPPREIWGGNPARLIRQLERRPTE